MTLLATVFSLCAAANPGRVDASCPTASIVSWTTTIRREASKNDIDPYLVAALIQRESGFNPRANSRVGATGLMQLLPNTAASGGLPANQIRNPTVNIRLGCRHLKRWFEFCGTVQGALSTYSGRGSCRPSSYSRAIFDKAVAARAGLLGPALGTTPNR